MNVMLSQAVTTNIEILRKTTPAAPTRITQAIAVNGNASLAFVCDLKGQRDTNNFVCVPATGQVNRL